MGLSTGMNPEKKQTESWNMGLHEDNLFDSRMQVFLTVHAILIMAAGFAVQKDQPSMGFLIILALLGVLLGFVWLIIQVQSCLIVARIEKELEGTGGSRSVYDDVFDDLEKSRPLLFRFSRNQIMTWFVPPVLIVWWAVFAGFALYGAFTSSP